MYTNGGRGSRDEKAPTGLHYHPAALGSLFEVKAIENLMCLEKLRIVAKLPFEPVLRSFVEKGTVTTFEERKQDCEVKGQPGTLLSNGRQTEVESGKLKAESRK
ncbi:hypothetical protein K0M31_017704 [Melipona bicolor]|uniref:Uncharacterized protein n=1 Tax=Melipona bicolor TaxID=60889 RepID=A0AA40G6N6_9HYME|nr:hypothetical protein K0M31_017704 [Melipona bicolor]